MLDSKTILAPAKLNIFLKVLNKRIDEYHSLRTGITFIDLFDKIEIKKSDETKIKYKGFFKPKNNNYNDCIILKTLKFLDLDKNLHFDITVTKNIPVQGGLGSASTNAAGLIKGLHDMNYIHLKEPSAYVSIGSDIPSFLFAKNCIITGIGEKISPTTFPKLYFLLIKPNFNNSTKEMYEKLDIKNNHENSDDTGNDFEKIVLKENLYFNEIFSYLKSFDNALFTRMTGTGSCFYAAFEKKIDALKANEIFKNKYSKLWTHVCENNINYS